MRTLVSIGLVAFALLSSLFIPPAAWGATHSEPLSLPASPSVPQVSYLAPASHESAFPLAQPAALPHGGGGGICNSAQNNALFANAFTVTFNPYGGGQLPMLPAIGNVSQYTRAIGITVTSDSSSNILNQVLLNVWSTNWNNVTGGSTPPTAPAQWTLPITNGVANGLLNDEKYFPPGANVYFNVSILFSNSTVSYYPVFSPCPMGAEPAWASASPTWRYLVDGAWPINPVTGFGGWSSAITLWAYPNIFAGVQPGLQPVTIHMKTVDGDHIGGANIYYYVNTTNSLTQNTTCQPYCPGGLSFTPSNASSMSATIPEYFFLGNSTRISFHILAWDDWSGGAVNEIWSPFSSYVVGNGGTWCNTNQPFSTFLNIATSDGTLPNVAPSGNFSAITAGNGSGGIANPSIPALSAVNVTISTVSSNTTINYAYVFYNTTYQGHKQGPYDLVFNKYNATSQYTGDLSQQNQNTWNPSVFGPFPPGVTVTFYVQAADVLGCQTRSPNYEFHTNPSLPNIVHGRTFFYVAAFDSGKNTYAVGAQVTFSNATWVDHTQTNPLGFAYPNLTGSAAPAYLAVDQNYNVTVTYEGHTQAVLYNLTLTSNKTLTFYFDTSSTTAIVYATNAQAFTPELVLGLAVGAAAVIPVYFIWREMRRRAEAEEKRITL